MVTKMLDEEQDEEHEEAILCLDSEADVLQDQAAVGGESWNQALLHEESSFNYINYIENESSMTYRRLRVS